MNLLREIAAYEKNSEDFIESIAIDIPLTALREIFNVDEKDDPEMYYVYEVTVEKLLKLVELDPRLAALDLTKADLFCECSSL